MSIHTARAQAKAQKLGAASGSEHATPLWDMPKRELIEIALHLGAVCTGNYDDAIRSDAAATRVLEERETLKSNGLI